MTLYVFLCIKVQVPNDPIIPLVQQIFSQTARYSPNVLHSYRQSIYDAHAFCTCIIFKQFE